MINREIPDFNYPELEDKKNNNNIVNIKEEKNGYTLNGDQSVNIDNDQSVERETESALAKLNILFEKDKNIEATIVRQATIIDNYKKTIVSLEDELKHKDEELRSFKSEFAKVQIEFSKYKDAYTKLITLVNKHNQEAENATNSNEKNS